MLERLLADWRRGRALKTLRPGERQSWEWDSKTRAGTLCFNLRFDIEGPVLVVTFYEIWPKDPDAIPTVVGRNATPRAELGVEGVFAFIGLIAGAAGDIGCVRLRLRGQRTRLRRKRLQSVEFDLARFRRGHRLGR